MPRGRPKQANSQAGGNGKSLSKLAAVRESLTTLGKDAKPMELQDHLKKTYNIDMDPSYISKYKSLILSKGRKGKRRGRKPRAAGAVAETAAPAARTATRSGGIRLEDIKVVKELSGRLGADRVRELVDLVAR